MKEYYVGTKVFLDFMSALPTGRVVEIIEEGNGNTTEGKIKVKLDKVFGFSNIYVGNANTVVPIKQLIYRGIYKRIRTDYSWKKK